jgi:hypothetical protein
MAQVPTTWMAPNTAPSNEGALELSIADPTNADGYFYFGGQPIVTTHRQAHDERPGRPNRGGSIGS